jgi:hypothetical protein
MIQRYYKDAHLFTTFEEKVDRVLSILNGGTNDRQDVEYLWG